MMMMTAPTAVPLFFFYFFLWSTTSLCLSVLHASAFTTTSCSSAGRRAYHHQYHHPCENQRRQEVMLHLADNNNKIGKNKVEASNDDEHDDGGGGGGGNIDSSNNSNKTLLSSISDSDSNGGGVAKKVHGDDDDKDKEKNDDGALSSVSGASGKLPLFSLYSLMASRPNKTDTTSWSSATSTSSTTTKDDGDIIVTEETIKSLFVLFNSALATGVPKIVAKRYAEDAVLLPCTSEGPCMTPEKIVEYYDHYLLEKPQKKVLEDDEQYSRRIRIGHDKTWAEDTGLCEITFRAPRDGSTMPRRAKARYSFLYTYDASVGQWRILHHHSSLLDSSSSSEEGSTKPRETGTFPLPLSSSMKSPSSWSGPMTVERVQNLFHLLVQDTWAMQDADAVASRFHRHEGMLIPLNVYDRPRVGYDDILDYFDEFLYDYRPIISQVQRTGITLNERSKEKQRWAKDVGTMQITFRKDYSTMDARYSVDYILDESDGQWKILQFHMTPLPKDWHRLRIPQTSRRNLNPSMDYADTISSTSQTDDMQPLLSKAGKNQDEKFVTRESKASRGVSTPVVTETDVRNWFEEWNAALATGDVDAVANRYGNKAILVPSLSYSTPRTTPEAIKEYYQVFLWSRPQANVLQRHITISDYFVKDVGVLEYRFKDNNAERVKERFSFLYLFDEVGGWKIMHHQQSLVAGEIQEAGPREGSSPSFFQ